MISPTVLEVAQKDVEALEQTLAKAAAKTGCHNWQEAHDALEEHRQLHDALKAMDNKSAIGPLIKQWESFERPLVNQQMAAYTLLDRCKAGDNRAIVNQAAEMVSALEFELN